jgi:hypothetical protein
VKFKWKKTKLDLDLQLSMAKQYTKYQINICKQREKKSGKLVIRDIFLSPRAIIREKSMDQNQTLSVPWYGKAMYQISNEYEKKSA